MSKGCVDITAMGDGITEAHNLSLIMYYSQGRQWTQIINSNFSKVHENVKLNVSITFAFNLSKTYMKTVLEL